MEIDYFLYKDRRAGNEYQLRWYIYGEGKNDGRYNSGWLC